MYLLAKELLMDPVIDGRLALGEGTGAVMMLSLLDIALSIYSNGTTFSDIQIEQYQRIII
jgi:nicotinate-nucleotide--dimethylbenzimidazole phosphoribosyltransferase